MPICRPACLRPMLRKAEYRQLAERVNRRVAWQTLGWEMMLFHVTAFLVPPLAAFLMVCISMVLVCVLIGMCVTMHLMYACMLVCMVLITIYQQPFTAPIPQAPWGHATEANRHLRLLLLSMSSPARIQELAAHRDIPRCYPCLH